MAYLDAMGIDAYVSRRQLPGAAPTPRVRVSRAAPVAAAGYAPRPPDDAPPTPAAESPQRVKRRLPDLAPDRPVPAAVSRAGKTPGAIAGFRLALVSCGGWLWLEELETDPAVPGQDVLLRAIAAAFSAMTNRVEGNREYPAPAELITFDWPVHKNRQLDLGPEAARDGATGFVRRRLEQQGRRGLILLGPGAGSRLSLDELGSVPVLSTVGTAAMLRDPLLKARVWRDLYPLLRP